MPKRRTSVADSVFERKDRPRGTARWVAQLHLGADPTTHRPRYKVSYHLTKAAAAEALSKMQEGKRAGSIVPSAGPITVAQQVAAWLAVRSPRWRPGTDYEYRRLLDRHVLPALGAVRLDRLTGQQIALFEAELSATTGAWELRKLHKLLAAPLAQAVKWRLIGRSPMDDVEPPPVPTPVRARVWSATEVRAFLAGAAADADYALWLLLVTTGCRIGELLALRWDNLDDARGTITVAGNVVSVPHQGAVFGDPKTAAGRRTITLPPGAVPVLRRHWVQIAQARMHHGPAWTDLGLVFPSTRYASRGGQARSPRAVLERFHVLSDRIGVARCRLHGLRHFHATDLFRRGAHPKAVQGRLGHASVGITMDLYTEYLPEVDAALADGLADLLPAPGTVSQLSTGTERH